MRLAQSFRFLLLVACMDPAHAATPAVPFDVRLARSGKWSDASTWVNKNAPRSGDKVQIRTGHVVTYDANSDDAVRVLHVAGTMSFARDKSTRLNVGLLKVLPGEECGEDGFNCHEMTEVAEPADGAATAPHRGAALEIGTRENPLSASVTATIRLTCFEGMDTNALPAPMNCGGRMDIHGAPMNRTWMNLGVTAKMGDSKVTLTDPVTGWKVGDRVIITVSKESEYGYRFEIAKLSNYDPTLNIRQPDGSRKETDVRTIPFLRFEDNESRSGGPYNFNFGDDRNGSVRGDRRHPFIARNLRAWQTHYVLRPNLQFFLMDGLEVKDGVYGVYHADYDAHVYRRIHFDNVNSEPINRGHDDESVQYGTFTYDGVRLENCRVGRDPLIQLACTSPRAGAAGHFRGLMITNSFSRGGKVVDLGGGPRNEELQHAVAYYFHDAPGAAQEPPLNRPTLSSSEVPAALPSGLFDLFPSPPERASRVGEGRNRTP